VSAETIVARIEAIARDHHVLRAKGYVAIAGKPMRLLVQGVGTRVRAQFDRPWRTDEPRLSRIVVIGERGFDHAAITAALTG
jgi:cobalamin biosynthesis protein CobW